MYPLPIMSHIYSCVGTEPVMILVINVALVLKEGVAVSDMRRFLETTEGKDVCAKSNLYSMSPGQHLWIPSGYVPVVAYVAPPPSQPAGQKKKQGADKHALGVVSTIFIKDAMRKLPDNVFAALSINTTHLAKKSGEKLYKDRAILWEEFMNSCRKTDASTA